MRTVPKFLLRSIVAAAMPFAAHAAGTYYTGGYQSPQQQRTYSNTSGGYSQYSTYNRTTSYGANNGAYRANTNTGYQTRNNQAQSQQSRQQSQAKSGSSKSGFYLDAGISHEYAQWQFDMNESGSILHYSDLAWNVLSISGGYVFDAGNTKLQIDAGLKYGLQSGESYMVDDDITNGGYLVAYITDSTGETNIGNQVGHAFSVGTSKDGDMFGFNIGLGLTDIFQWGNVKVTPSVGYRYFKYKLTTTNNYGMAIDTAACFTTEDGEIQCDPIIVFVDSTGKMATVWRDTIDQLPEVPGGYQYYETEGTFYFEQPGTSHSYEVDWSGPYLAMDFLYDINANNAVNGRVELGFPGYTSTGDQPYRFDWAHPKSVEDSAGMFSALHLGLGANYMTAINDKVMLTIGLTYDYYTVSDVDAKTYLNSAYYTGLYNTLETAWKDNHSGSTDGFLDAETGNQQAIAIKALEAECPGWVCSMGSEVNSFYRSLGVRVGVNAKF